MNVRVIPTKLHGRLDYITAPGLIAAPELLRLDGARGATLPPRVAGVAAAIYSALTDYETGIRRVIPMPAHLALDAGSGVALALTPWLSGAARRGPRHWLPHALIGASEIALAAATRTRPPRATVMRRAWGAVARTVPKPVAIGTGIGVAAVATVALVARKRLWQGVAAVAEVVEEAADAVEDAAEDLADVARARAENGSD
jgi:hypothetical protein